MDDPTFQRSNWQERLGVRLADEIAGGEGIKKAATVTMVEVPELEARWKSV